MLMLALLTPKANFISKYCIYNVGWLFFSFLNCIEATFLPVGIIILDKTQYLDFRNRVNIGLREAVAFDC